MFIHYITVGFLIRLSAQNKFEHMKISIVIAQENKATCEKVIHLSSGDASKVNKNQVLGGVADYLRKSSIMRILKQTFKHSFSKPIFLTVSVENEKVFSSSTLDSVFRSDIKLRGKGQANETRFFQSLHNAIQWNVISIDFNKSLTELVSESESELIIEREFINHSLKEICTN